MGRPALLSRGGGRRTGRTGQHTCQQNDRHKHGVPVSTTSGCFAAPPAGEEITSAAEEGNAGSILFPVHPQAAGLHSVGAGGPARWFDLVPAAAPGVGQVQSVMLSGSLVTPYWTAGRHTRAVTPPPLLWAGMWEACALTHACSHQHHSACGHQHHSAF